MKRFIAILLTAVTVLAGTAPYKALAGFSGYGEDEQFHPGISYSDMEFKGYDGAALRAVIADMEAKRGDVKNSDAIVSDYQKIIAEFDVFATQYALNQVRYYSDVTVEEYADLELELSSLWTELADASLIAVREALKSPCGDALKAYINDERMVEDFLEYEDMTEREQELNVIGDELVHKYDVSQQQDYEVVIDGVTWTEAKAEEALGAGDISSDEYNAITLQTSMERNKVEAGIYVDLVNAKNEMAQIEGYKNYAEYAYENVYNRDYTTDDAKKLYAYVKKYIVPLKDRIYSYIYYTATEKTYTSIYSDYLMEDENLVDMIRPYVSAVHPDLAIAYDYLKNYHTYEMDYIPSKMDVGYTTSFYQYGTPFIFNCPNGSYYDVETLIHEFGHYNNSFHNDFHCLTDTTNMDVAEIHSQGLEMLMFGYFDEIYGEDNANLVRFLTLYNMLSSVSEGCLYDEFQNEVFAYEGKLTVSEVNRIFRKLAVQYGYNYGNDLDEAFGWTGVSHTFHSPLYYISYATSALAALDLFSLSLEDREGTVDLYMTLTTYGLDTPYCELLDKLSIPDVFEEETIKDIAGAIDSYAADLYDASGIRLPGYITVVIALAFILVIGTLIVAIVATSKNRKRRNNENSDQERFGDPA